MTTSELKNLLMQLANTEPNVKALFDEGINLNRNQGILEIFQHSLDNQKRNAEILDDNINLIKEKTDKIEKIESQQKKSITTYEVIKAEMKTQKLGQDKITQTIDKTNKTIDKLSETIDKLKKEDKTKDFEIMLEPILKPILNSILELNKKIENKEKKTVNIKQNKIKKQENLQSKISKILPKQKPKAKIKRKILAK